MRRLVTLTIALVAPAGLLAACGAGDDPTIAAPRPAADHMDDGHMGGGHMDDGRRGHGANSPVAPGARQIDVTAEDFRFDPDEIVVRAGEDIAITLTSVDILHDFVIDEFDAHVAADVGETATGGFRAGEPGTYTFYCDVPGHRQAGMEGTLVVEE